MVVPTIQKFKLLLPLGLSFTPELSCLINKHNSLRFPTWCSCQAQDSSTFWSESDWRKSYILLHIPQTLFHESLVPVPAVTQCQLTSDWVKDWGHMVTGMMVDEPWLLQHIVMAWLPFRISNIIPFFFSFFFCCSEMVLMSEP